MKEIQYQIASEINRGTEDFPVTETVFHQVSMPYTDANYQMALSDAYQGDVTVVDVPLWLQALACAALVTITELFAGVILNLWLKLEVWDYSNLPGNFLGQICPQFAAVWWVLCLVFIPVFDWMWYLVAGGEKPKYYF